MKKSGLLQQIAVAQRGCRGDAAGSHQSVSADKAASVSAGFVGDLPLQRALYIGIQLHYYIFVSYHFVSIDE